MKKFLSICLILSIVSIQGAEFLSPDRIEKGMEGFGLTSFTGSEIDTFNVKILGVLKGAGVGHTIILARLEGGPLKETGVLSGMSGSPVFVNGKLIGAVAYAWIFSKEPICGIQPIEEMLKASTVKGVDLKKLVPLKNILSISGVGSSPFLDSLSGRYDMEVIPSGKAKEVVKKLGVGSPCGVVLVDGDANIAVLGTITYINDKTVYAFGHSAFLSGKCRLPFSSAYVTALLPSIYSSFKFLVPSEIVGSVDFDGFSGIRARIGQMPEWTEYEIKIGGMDRKYRLAKANFLYSYLIGTLTFENLIEAIGGDYAGTAKGKISISLSSPMAGNRKIEWKLFSSGEDLHRKLSMEISSLIDILINNPYDTLNLRSISLNLNVSNKVMGYKLKEIKLLKSEFKPGEKADIHLVFSRYRMGDTTLIVYLNMPSIEGDYKIIAGSGSSLYDKSIKEILGSNLKIGISRYLSYLEKRPYNNQLRVELVSKGNRLGGTLLPQFPPSIEMIYRGEFSKGEYVIRRVKKFLDGEIYGIKKAEIKIKQNSLGEK